MAKFDDFDLDLKATSTKSGGISPMVTSVSLCTPGCITGVIMTCTIKTATCGCHVAGK
ncbi:gallidermin/nisin family lantibiotic [Clostridium sp. E02]|uniref:gallidermin/nisin family lantibiotic n=1 Tax=Clostridium sp. E02 TaxID=2487134 RepID=UPI000F5319DE|nr:gallidermin/nisin family lantibiotic [Clostridium sp. E02]